METPTQISVLLVDDDPTFGKILKAVCEHHGVSLLYYDKARDAYQHLEESLFDIAIIDYDLGMVNGIQLGNFLERTVGNVPVILVSALKMPYGTEWPYPVVKFLQKQDGPTKIVEEVLKQATKLNRKAG